MFILPDHCLVECFRPREGFCLLGWLACSMSRRSGCLAGCWFAFVLGAWRINKHAHTHTHAQKTSSGCVDASVWWRTKAQQTGLWRGMAELSSIYHSFIIDLSSLRNWFIVFLLAFAALAHWPSWFGDLGCPSSMALAGWRSGLLFLAYVSGCTARTNMHTCTHTRKKKAAARLIP